MRTVQLALALLLLLCTLGSAFRPASLARAGAARVLAMGGGSAPVANSGRNQAYKAAEGSTLCYDLFRRRSSVGFPDSPIVFLPGLIRQKSDVKATNLQSFCRKNDITFFCADYLGVGRSSGSFSDGSVGRWAQDTIQLLDNVVGTAEGKVILVGHGVGAWVAILVAAKRPDLVAGIVGMSADPDFTELLLMKTLAEDVKQKIMTDGSAEITWGSEKYLISKNLIEDGRKNLLLSGGDGSIPVTCPVRLVHALNDEEVPKELALKLITNLKSADASCTLIKGASHALDGEQDMKTMRTMITEIMTAFKGDFDLTSPGSG